VRPQHDAGTVAGPGLRVSRPARFVCVGLVGFILQTLALQALTTRAGVPYLVATALAVEIAILHNFVWHEWWTWRDRARASGGRLHRLARFNGLSALISITGNVGLTGLLVDVGGFQLLAANALAVVSLSLVTYASLDHWVFARENGASRRRWPHHAHRVTVLLIVTAAASTPAPAQAQAAGASAGTVAAWSRYVALAEARIESELRTPGRFLALNALPEAERLRIGSATQRGEVPVVNVVNERGGGDGLEIPDGMIHHWRGWLFIPKASVDEVMRAVTDPTGPHAHRQEDVLEARVLDRTPGGLRLFLKLQRRSIVTVSYNTEHAVQYRAHGRDRASSRSVATRIRELDNVGTADERERPHGEDRGFLWGLNSYWRYQAVPGGVVVEMESLTLSRDLPWGVGAVVRPLIDRVARESLVRTLTSMRARFEPA
jgi:putative flippase GtrA